MPATDVGKLPSIFDYWNSFYHDASQKTGRTFYPTADQQNAEWMQEEGFKEVHVQEYKVPIGPWQEEKGIRMAGLLNQAVCYDGVDGGLKLGIEVLKESYTTMQVVFANTRTAYRDKWYGLYSRW